MLGKEGKYVVWWLLFCHFQTENIICVNPSDKVLTVR